MSLMNRHPHIVSFLFSVLTNPIRRKVVIVPIILASMAAIPSVVFSQNDTFTTLEGTVVNRSTGETLPNVNIVVLGTPYGTTTDAEGYFILTRIPAGRNTIIFSHLGFAVYRFIQDFEAGETYFHQVDMFEQAIRFNETEVIAERYPDSRRSADGHLITRRDIMESGIRNFGDLLRAYIPRIEVQEDGFDLLISLTRETSLSQRYGGRQNPLIILNGINIGNSPTNLNGLIKPDEIQTVEVIRGPSAMMYGSEGEQGVIIVDTVRPENIEANTFRAILFGSVVVSYLLYFVFFW